MAPAAGRAEPRAKNAGHLLFACRPSPQGPQLTGVSFREGQAFWISFLSGVAEPIGAVVGYVLLMPFIDGNPAILPGMLAFVAGIMVYISIDELLPLAHRYGKGHVVLIGLILGMFIMALSLIMLAWA